MISIDHFKDVNNNKGVGTLLRMSGPEAFPVAPFFKSQICQNKRVRFKSSENAAVTVFKNNNK